MEQIKSASQIAILMATYNGDKYLREQIDSLFAQTYQDWHLYIHDDGSKDNTITIINEYAQHHPDKITLLEYSSQGGACRNFLSMLESVDASYYMFCDQDDVWLPEKTELEMKQMKLIEQQDKSFPIIINTDLTVVDLHLNIISSSFWKYERIYPEYFKKFEDFAAMNIATGCTMLFNHCTKEAIIKPYDKALMHDAWITLCAINAHGIINNIITPTVMYRQHGNNTLGARDARKLTLTYRILHIIKILQLNISHYNQLNAVRTISVWRYICSKIKYRKFLKRTLI